MSASRLIERPEVKAYLRDKIMNPLFRAATRVPRVAANPHVIGTAFDYALRAGLCARHAVSARDLVAEHAPDSTILYGTRANTKARVLLHGALEDYRRSDGSDELSERIASACLVLARLEILWRSGNPKGFDRPASAEEIAELRQLYAIVPWRDFAPRHVLCLNPVFGEGSHRIGGADADVVLDDTVVEIKTVKDQALSIEMVRQGVVYALLARRFGLNDEAVPNPVSRVGVYFSRAGELCSWPLEELVSVDREAEILDFLLDYAARDDPE